MATATTSKKTKVKPVDTEETEVENKTSSLVGNSLSGLWFVIRMSFVLLYRSVVQVFGLKTTVTEPAVKTMYWQYVLTTLFVLPCLAVIGYAFPLQYGISGMALFVLLLEVPYLAALSRDFKLKSSRRMVLKGVILSCVMFLLGIVAVQYPVALGIGTVFWLSWLTLDKLLGVNVADDALLAEEHAKARAMDEPVSEESEESDE